MKADATRKGLLLGAGMTAAFGGVPVTLGATPTTGSRRSWSPPSAASRTCRTCRSPRRVFNGEELDRRGVTDLNDIQQVAPSIAINTYNRSTFINIRGVGIAQSAPTSNPGVAYYIDGQLIPHEQFIGQSFYDIGSIEVLRGPQGTLTGQNSTGGAIYVRYARAAIRRVLRKPRADARQLRLGSHRRRGEPGLQRLVRACACRPCTTSATASPQHRAEPEPAGQFEPERAARELRLPCARRAAHRERARRTLRLDSDNNAVKNRAGHRVGRPVRDRGGRAVVHGPVRPSRQRRSAFRADLDPGPARAVVMAERHDRSTRPTATARPRACRSRRPTNVGRVAVRTHRLPDLDARGQPAVDRRRPAAVGGRRVPARRGQCRCRCCATTATPRTSCSPTRPSSPRRTTNRGRCSARRTGSSSPQCEALLGLRHSSDEQRYNRITLPGPPPAGRHRHRRAAREVRRDDRQARAQLARRRRPAWSTPRSRRATRRAAST